MIVRIVKMTFQSDKVEQFQKMFDEKKNLIRDFEGCKRLELLRDVNHSNIFFTYSFWDHEDDLNKYRHSKLFKGVWAVTKTFFSKEPEAWSLNQEVMLT